MEKGETQRWINGDVVKEIDGERETERLKNGEVGTERDGERERQRYRDRERERGSESDKVLLRAYALFTLNEIASM
jgi:hypothetical protein